MKFMYSTFHIFSFVRPDLIRMCFKAHAKGFFSITNVIAHTFNENDIPEDLVSIY